MSVRPTLLQNRDYELMTSNPRILPGGSLRGRRVRELCAFHSRLNAKWCQSLPIGPLILTNGGFSFKLKKSLSKWPQDIRDWGGGGLSVTVTVYNTKLLYSTTMSY